MAVRGMSSARIRLLLIENARWCLLHAMTLRALGRPGQAAAALREAATARVRAGKYRGTA